MPSASQRKIPGEGAGTSIPPRWRPIKRTAPVYRGNEGRLSDVQRHAIFLGQRLKAMGAEVRMRADDTSAEGRLGLSGTPFESLQERFRVEYASFYTLGHNRVKFFEPREFFSLPAIEVSRCETLSDIEVALRQAWNARIIELRKAQSWLDELAVTSHVTGADRLELRSAGSDDPPARVQSPAEIQLPSAGPLAEASPEQPGERRYRPLRNIEHSSDLEIGISDAIDQLSKRYAASQRRGNPPTSEVEPIAEGERRALVLDHDRASLAATRSLLNLHGFQVAAYQDPERALTALRAASVDIVISDVRLPRFDGLEFTVRIRQLPGVENLPVVLIDDRPNKSRRDAARNVGATAYFRKPLHWSDMGEDLMELVERSTVRRFERFEVRLPVHANTADGQAIETLDEAARGGIRIRSQREVFPGAVERYEIVLPAPLEPVTIEGQVASRETCPGSSTLIIGVKILRFLEDAEPRWIRFIEGLARAGEAKSTDSIPD